MEVLLIPLAKGLLSLVGASSLLFMSAMRDIEVQIEEMQLDIEEGELLEAQPEFKFKVEPLKE